MTENGHEWKFIPELRKFLKESILNSLDKIIIFMNLAFELQSALNKAQSLVEKTIISPLSERNLGSFFYSLMLNHSIPLVQNVYATKYCETGIDTGKT